MPITIAVPAEVWAISLVAVLYIGILIVMSGVANQRFSEIFANGISPVIRQTS